MDFKKRKKDLIEASGKENMKMNKKRKLFTDLHCDPTEIEKIKPDKKFNSVSEYVRFKNNSKTDKLSSLNGNSSGSVLSSIKKQFPSENVKSPNLKLNLNKRVMSSHDSIKSLNDNKTIHKAQKDPNTSQSRNKFSDEIKSQKSNNTQMKIKKGRNSILGSLKPTNKSVYGKAPDKSPKLFQNKTEIRSKINLCSPSCRSVKMIPEFLDNVKHEKLKNVGIKKGNSIVEVLKTPDRFACNSNDYSLVASLSDASSDTALHPDAINYKNNFNATKEELACRLFAVFNKEVFDNKLPMDTKIEWSNRMFRSAGFSKNQRSKQLKSGVDIFSSRIQLSTKIVDRPARLRDVLIHEMCHAAAWIINHIKDGHGQYWKSWTQKAMNKFPCLPLIKRCHAFDVETKYTYRCKGCGYSFGRHSKSINVEQKCCGYCKGRFEILLNKK